LLATADGVAITQNNGTRNGRHVRTSQHMG